MKDKAKITVLKEDCALFSRLYIACQNREGNLEDFFKFKNQPWWPSLESFSTNNEYDYEYGICKLVLRSILW